MTTSSIGSLHEFIGRQLPDLPDITQLTDEQLDEFRKKYIEQMLEEELGELTEVENAVINSIGSRKMMTAALHPLEIEKATRGEKLADMVASFGGSWTFIAIFFCFILLWMTVNIWWLRNKAFDPYPFILLNLLLSCVAAIQAPIIMMSQNRQDEKDRIRAQQDYQINLKAEVEIRLLHEKMDHMLLRQNKRLLEIQKIQVEFMENISQMLRHKK